MQEYYDSSAPKKPTNLTVNSDLLRVAKALQINLSATFETALVERVKRAAQCKWLEENSEAIQSYNDFIERNGAFSDHVRQF